MPLPVVADDSPRVQELLNSNTAPLDSEVPYIHSLRLHHAQILQDMDAQILKAQAALDLLQQERSEIEEEISRCKAITHPIRRLPVEILGEIFLECFASEGTLWEQKSVPEFIEIPRIITQVCAKWRMTGLSLPRLWTQISLVLSAERKDDDVPGAVSGLEFYLQLSQDMPLSVWLDWSSAGDLESDPLRETVLASSHRWETLVVSAFNGLEQLNQIRGSVPLLRNLRLDVHEHDASDPISAFGVAPNLRALHVCHAYYNIQNCLLPFTQLTQFCSEDLDLDDNYDVDPLQIMTLCPNLEECSFFDLKDVDGASHLAIEMRHLKTLKTVDVWGSISFFSSITTPVLTHLLMDNSDYDVCLLDFLLRSQPPLIKLKLSFRDMKSEDILQLLRAVSTLEELDILGHFCLTAEVFQKLTYRPGDTETLAPCLSHLTVSYRSLREISSVIYVPFAEMLQSRCDLRSGPASVALAGPPPQCTRLRYLNVVQSTDSSELEYVLRGPAAMGMEIWIAGVQIS